MKQSIGVSKKEGKEICAQSVTPIENSYRTINDCIKEGAIASDVKTSTLDSNLFINKHPIRHSIVFPKSVFLSNLFKTASGIHKTFQNIYENSPRVHINTLLPYKNFPISLGQSINHYLVSFSEANLEEVCKISLMIEPTLFKKALIRPDMNSLALPTLYHRRTENYKYF